MNAVILNAAGGVVKNLNGVRSEKSLRFSLVTPFRVRMTACRCSQ